MSIDERSIPRALYCSGCAYPNEAGDRFCARCGDPVGTPVPGSPPEPRSSVPAQVDATTRYLSAAAHLDPGFADEAIAEHLVERTRAVAPSPGVDSATVLRDAVAARARRRVRDSVLLALLVTVVVTSPSAAVAWLLMAVVGALVIGVSGRRPRWQVAAAGVVAVLGLSVLATYGTAMVAFSGVDVAGGGTSRVAVLLLLSAAVLAVCLVDEAMVENLVRYCFRPSAFVPATALSAGWERTARMFGTARWKDELDRVAKAEERGRRLRGQADVIVYRNRVPFVGAGVVVGDEVVALPLTPGTSGDGARLTPRPFTAADLQAHVAAVVGELRDSASLAPSRRLAGMTIREQVLVPAERLVTNLHRQPRPAVLPGLDGPPETHLPVDDVRHLADRPEEWARYYRCYRVEAWDRDLATSTYFAAGTDARMLYLEWTHCVLHPIKERYREIDRTPRVGIILRGVGQAITLPVTAVERFRRVFHRFRPLPQRPGEVVPDRYGAGENLRELAADRRVQDFFQDADAIRYVKVVERAVFRAVGRFLEERGYSVVDFMEVAKAAIVNNTISVSGGQFGSGVALGIGTVNQQTNQGSNGSGKERG